MCLAQSLSHVSGIDQLYDRDILYSFGHQEGQLMPWNESTKMDEKLKFAPRFLDGELKKYFFCFVG
jgi:hypothetical protein